jgi:hypothetical protein
MQISKEQFDGWVQEIQDLTKKLNDQIAYGRDRQNKINNFDAILTKIIRAAQGIPLIQSDDLGYGVMTPNFMGHDPHRCQPPTSEELQAEMLKNQTTYNAELQSRIAAVIAVAQFAKEHKA